MQELSQIHGQLPPDRLARMARPGATGTPNEAPRPGSPTLRLPGSGGPGSADQAPPAGPSGASRGSPGRPAGRPAAAAGRPRGSARRWPRSPDRSRRHPGRPAAARVGRPIGGRDAFSGRRRRSTAGRTGQRRITRRRLGPTGRSGAGRSRLGVRAGRPRESGVRGREAGRGVEAGWTSGTSARSLVVRPARLCSTEPGRAAGRAPERHAGPGQRTERDRGDDGHAGPPTGRRERGVVRRGHDGGRRRVRRRQAVRGRHRGRLESGSHRVQLAVPVTAATRPPG